MKISFPAQITAHCLPVLVLIGLGLICPFTITHAGPVPSTRLGGAAPVVPAVTPTCKIVRINTNASNLIYEPLPAGNNVQPQYSCPVGYVPIGIRVEDISTSWTPGPAYYESGKAHPPGFDYIQLRGQGAVIGTNSGSYGISTTYFASTTNQSSIFVQYQLNYGATGEGLAGKDRPNRTRLICAKREIIFTSNLSQCYNN